MTSRDSRGTKANLYDGFAVVSRALASGRRLEILDLLSQCESSVQQIADELCESAANTSQHLKVLERSGIVASRRAGTFVIYRLARPEVALLLDTIRTIGAEQLSEVEPLLSAHLGRREEVEWITRSEFIRRLRRGELIVLDTRPRADFEAGHLTGAVSIPAGELATRLAELPLELDIVAYCRGPYCAFGDEAVRILRQHGRRAFRLEEGFPALRRAGLPVTPS